MLDKHEYHSVKNVTLAAENGTTQLDHIIVSRYGVVIIIRGVEVLLISPDKGTPKVGPMRGRLKRVFNIDIESCGKCGGDIRIIPKALAPLAGQALACIA